MNMSKNDNPTAALMKLVESMDRELRAMEREMSTLRDTRNAIVLALSGDDLSAWKNPHRAARARKIAEIDLEL
jgi:hypothetical protein